MQTDSGDVKVLGRFEVLGLNQVAIRFRVRVLKHSKKFAYSQFFG